MRLGLTHGQINTPFVNPDGTLTRSALLWLQSAQMLINSPAGMLHPVVQANLPQLEAKDSGYLAYVSDFAHTLQWNGTGWTWGPGELGSDYVEAFLNGPTGVGWHICDGSTVNRLNADGTITAVTLPDLSTAAYLKLGTAALAGPNAADGQSGATSAGTPAGVVSQPTFAGDLDTSSSVSAGTPAGTNGNDSASVAVQAGAGTTVAADPHTHTFTGSPLAGHAHTVTPSGTVSRPTFTGDVLVDHTHAPGTIELENTQLKAYYRI